jgi:hypothetical protein
MKEVAPGVLDGPNLQNLGRASSYLFFKPAKTSNLVGAKMPQKAT